MLPIVVVGLEPRTLAGHGIPQVRVSNYTGNDKSNRGVKVSNKPHDEIPTVNPSDAGHLGAWEASGSSPPQKASNGVGRLALTPHEAALALGVGRTFFFETVLPELASIRRGRKRLIPVRELERWIDRNAARVPVAGRRV